MKKYEAVKARMTEALDGIDQHLTELEVVPHKDGPMITGLKHRQTGEVERFHWNKDGMDIRSKNLIAGDYDDISDRCIEKFTTLSIDEYIKWVHKSADEAAKHYATTEA